MTGKQALLSSTIFTHTSFENFGFTFNVNFEVLNVETRSYAYIN